MYTALHLLCLPHQDVFELADLSALVAEIEAEAFEFDVPMGDRTAREAQGDVSLGGAAAAKPSSKFITMDAICEEDEDEEEYLDKEDVHTPEKEPIHPTQSHSPHSSYPHALVTNK